MRHLRILFLTLALAGAVIGAGAQTPETPPFFFVQMSDPQFGMFTKDKEFAQETVNFEMAIATVNRWKPAFVVITGDLVNKAGDPAQIAEFQRIAKRISPSIPLYNIPGNHDVENEPTPETIAAYVKRMGPDHYSFRSRSLGGIVLNSTLIHTPAKAKDLYERQLAWLRGELPNLRSSGARHIVVFQHHPWFLDTAAEADQYFNIPTERRSVHLGLFHDSGVRYLFSGHYHRNASGRDGEIEMTTSGPVGMPLGDLTQSGLRVVIVRDSGLSHRYYNLGELPNQIEIK